MRKILLLLVLFFMTSTVCFSAPGFDPNNNKPRIYDNSANMKLLESLKKNYEKKYVKKINDNYYIDTAPMNAYRDEVVTPYALQKDNEYHYINK